MNKHIRWIAISGLSVLSLAGSRAALAKLNVVTTLPSFADIAQHVGGDEVKVRSLSKGTQDPHFVDAKPDLMLYLNRADLLIEAGLQLETGWLPPLQVGSRNGKIQTGGPGDLNMSTFIQLKEVPKGPLDRAQGDVHPGGNPHFMLDPRNGIVAAHAIASKLGDLDPAHAADYQKRADAYAQELKGKIAQWEAQLKPFRGREVVTYHKSWIYFTDWTGMIAAGHVEPKPGIPPSPEHVVELINLMKQKHVKLIVMEPYYPKGVAQQVAQETGAKLLVLPTEVGGAPGATSYFGVFDTIVSKLKAVQ